MHITEAAVTGCLEVLSFLKNYSLSPSLSLSLSLSLSASFFRFL